MNPPDQAAPAGGLSFEPVAGVPAGEVHWRVRGSMDFRHVGSLQKALSRAMPSRGGRLVLHLAEVAEIDSVGSALLVFLWRRGQSSGFSVQLSGASPELVEHLELYPVTRALSPPEAEPGIFESLGTRAYAARDAALALLVLAADVSVGAASELTRPWKLRWKDLIEQCILIGSRAVGIVMLITFLVGLTLAFQSAYQLRQFGAAIYVASLTAISMVREMGPLITAIIVVGRSGSAITSEVATMKVNEEIDAMEIMGIPFVDYVAVPRLLAMMFTLPLLTLLSDVVGIFGGWLVGVFYLELGTTQYILETVNSLVVDDLFFGVIKPLVFGWGAAIIALYHGTRVEGGAQEVGQATTASVVDGIFYIILITSLFSMIYYVFWPT